MGDVLRVSLIQTDVVWEDKRANLNKYAAILSHITGDCDLVVFPEMFTTGFSMRAEDLAECIDGETITEVKKWSRNYNVAIAGSFIARAGNVCFNRGFFIEPDGSEHYYDKRHLFRMGEEGRHFVSGSEKLIVNYRGWNICLLVCYDLRFPVWCRNVGNEYDLLYSFLCRCLHSQIVPLFSAFSKNFFTASRLGGGISPPNFKQMLPSWS